MTKIIPLEEAECKTLVEYMKLFPRQIKYSHLHQEMYTTSHRQKQKAKILGVEPGVPDYIIIINNQLIFIEMKRISGSKIQESQKEWRIALVRAGIESYICKGFDEAKPIIDQYLKINKK